MNVASKGKRQAGVDTFISEIQRKALEFRTPLLAWDEQELRNPERFWKETLKREKDQELLACPQSLVQASEQVPDLLKSPAQYLAWLFLSCCTHAVTFAVFFLVFVLTVTNSWTTKEGTPLMDPCFFNTATKYISVWGQLSKDQLSCNVPQNNFWKEYPE